MAAALPMAPDVGPRPPLVRRGARCCACRDCGSGCHRCGIGQCLDHQSGHRDHKLTLIEGEKKSDHILKPSQALQDICPKGCVLRLNDVEDDEYQLEPGDVVSIEEGYLYYDGPEQPPAQTAPPAAQPEQKKQ